jgi:hypothetical protein
MKRFLGAALVMILASSLGGLVRADEQEAKAILDKAIEKLGGEEKLSKAVAAATWKTKSKITFGDNENDFTSQATFQGLDHFRSEFDGEFNGNPFHGVTILNGNQGWRKFGDMDPMEMDDDAVANEKRTVYLQLVPATLVPLKGKGFKIDLAGEEKVGDKSATVVKATGPDGKDFKLYFDKESGLPVKLVATVMGFQGDEFTMETTYADYKDLDGIKKATKIESKRDGQTFVKTEITEFKILDKDKVSADTFAEPK